MRARDGGQCVFAQRAIFYKLLLLIIITCRVIKDELERQRRPSAWSSELFYERTFSLRKNERDVPFRLRKKEAYNWHYIIRGVWYEYVAPTTRESMAKSRGAVPRSLGDRSEGTQTLRRLDRARRKKHETDINQYSCENLQIARNCAA